MNPLIDNLPRDDVAFAIIADVSALNITNNVETLQALHTQLFHTSHGFDVGNTQAGYIKPNTVEPLAALLKTLPQPLDTGKVAHFVWQFFQLAPFTYGNSLVLRYFLTRYYPALDFRRITGIDSAKLLKDEISEESIATLLTHAKDTERSPAMHDVDDKWLPLADASITIGGEKFLLHNHQNHPCVLAVDGSLIPIDAIREDLRKHIKTSPKSWFLAPRELSIGKIAFAESNFPDGIKHTNTHVPLMHLERDYLDIMEDDALDAMVADAFKGKKIPDSAPHFFMTMGGSGTGKSSLLPIALQHTGDDNLVTASLDASRYFSDVYALYHATNHHNDDYKALSEFAKTIRNRVMERALTEGYNVLYDGSGIDYEGRYDAIIKRFKTAGYNTHILAASAPLFIENDRDDISFPVVKRLEKRMKKSVDPRSVPWEIALRKHIHYPHSKTAAAADWNVDHLQVQDKGGAKGAQYVLEQLFTCTDAILHELQTSKNLGGQALLSALRHNHMLPATNEHSPSNLADTVDFRVTAIKDGMARIIVTTDKTRTLDGVQKGALNAQAVGEQDLLFNTHPWHIPTVDYPLDIRQDEEHSYHNRLRHTVQKSSRRD